MNPIRPPIVLIPNQYPSMSMHITHRIHLPMLCLRSRNPKSSSTLDLTYQANENILELFALEAYIQSYVADPVVRDMEYFVQTVAITIADTLRIPVTACAHIDYEGLAQSQIIQCIANPTNHSLDPLA
jgi:7-cyano-7-deazaguanine reductase